MGQHSYDGDGNRLKPAVNSLFGHNQSESVSDCLCAVIERHFCQHNCVPKEEHCHETLCAFRHLQHSS